MPARICRASPAASPLRAIASRQYRRAPGSLLPQSASSAGSSLVSASAPAPGGKPKAKQRSHGVNKVLAVEVGGPAELAAVLEPLAAVDGEAVARDVARAVREQEHGRVGDLARRPEALHGHPVARHLLE